MVIKKGPHTSDTNKEKIEYPFILNKHDTNEYVWIVKIDNIIKLV